MRWIREHKLISAIVVILLALVIIFVVSAVTAGSGNGATGALNKGVSFVSGGFSSVVKTIKDNVTGIFSYKALQ